MAEKASGGAKPIRISDVAHPGKSAPSASSKPILVTNRPVLKDPMMVDDDPGDKESGSSTLPLSHLKIAPLSDEAKSKLADDKPEATSETKSEKAADKAEPDAEPAAADSETDSKVESEPTSSDDEPAPAETATVDEPSDEPTKESDLTTDDEATKPVPSSQKAEADQAAADLRTKELEDLAESRKFYLPINQVEKRRAKRYAWAGIFLIILLAVAWADIAADAGIINLPGIKPVTHFFSN